MRKKCLALLLISAMVIGLVACGSEGSSNSGGSTTTQTAPAGNTAASTNSTQTTGNTETAEPENTNPSTWLTDEKVTISVLAPFSSTLIEDPNDIKGNQAIEDRLNVHVEWTTYDTTVMMEKWTQILATGDLMDVMFPGGTNQYPGGFLQGVDDGILLDVNENKELFPNYFALLESSSAAKRQAAESDGVIHSAKVLTGTNTELAPHVAFLGQAIRLDLLEKMGLDIPTTIDELHDALVKGRDELGMTAPMILETNGGGNITYAWGIATGVFGSSPNIQFDQATQTVEYSAMKDAFYDYLATMKQWYAEDLIDKNFTTMGTFYTGDYSSFQNDTTLYYSNWLGALTGTTLHDSGLIDNPSCYMQAVPGFKLTENGQMGGASGDGIVQAQNIFINATSKVDKKILCGWVDDLYTKENMEFRYYGIEGESYTKDDAGNYTLTDKILHDPNGLTVSDALVSYAMRTYIGYQNDEADAVVSAASAPDGIDHATESGLIWRQNDYSIAMPSGVVLTTEEAETAANYATALSTMVAEYMVKTILGQTDETKESFKARLEASGVNEFVAVYQQAVDRFLGK